MRIRFVVGAPHCVDELLMSKHFAGVLNENAQNIVFRRRQRNGFSIYQNVSPSQVYEQTGGLIDRFASGKG